MKENDEEKIDLKLERTISEDENNSSSNEDQFKTECKEIIE